MSDAVEFEALKAPRIEALEEAWRQRRGGAVRAAAVLGEGGPGSGMDDDPFVPVLNLFWKETEAFHSEVHQAQHRNAGLRPYGDPLAPKGDSKRYTFWVANKQRWPLLFVCAQQLLGGCKVATATNERMHSPAEKINSKLRGALKPDKVERLTMAHIYLREETKRLAEHFPVAENGIDFDEVALQKMLDELYPALRDDPPPLLEEEDLEAEE